MKNVALPSVRRLRRGRPFSQAKRCRTMTRKAALAAAALAIALTTLAGPATAQPRCTQETLNVRGAPVTIGYCVIGPPAASSPDEIAVPVQATYTSPGVSFARALELHFVSGEGVSRILQ